MNEANELAKLRKKHQDAHRKYVERRQTMARGMHERGVCIFQISKELGEWPTTIRRDIHGDYRVNRVKQ